MFAFLAAHRYAAPRVLEPSEPSEANEVPPQGHELHPPGALIKENSIAASFARDFPHDKELDDLVRAFASGNYRQIHDQAPELASRATDPAVRDAARVLLERLQPDPLAKIILLAAVMLLAVMATWWITEARSRSSADHVRGGVSESTKALVES